METLFSCILFYLFFTLFKTLLFIFKILYLQYFFKLLIFELRQRKNINFFKNKSLTLKYLLHKKENFFFKICFLKKLIYLYTFLSRSIIYRQMEKVTPML